MLRPFGDEVKAGTYRKDAKKFASREWKPVYHNQDPRYQYLGYIPKIGGCFVADFKTLFMVPAGYLYDQLNINTIQRVVAMDTPYKEYVVQRFAGYLMRIGLPVDFDRLPQPEQEPP